MCVKAKLDMPHPKPISSHYGSIFREQETIATVLIHLYSVWRKVLFNQGGIYIYAKFNIRLMEQSFKIFYQLFT